MTMRDFNHQTVPQLLASCANIYRDKLAIKTDNATFSFLQVKQLANSVSKSLVSLNLKKGDRVAIWAPNLAEWVFAALGIESIGAILVPLNTRMKGQEAADIINRSGASVLFSLAEFDCGNGSHIRYFDLLESIELPQLNVKINLSGAGSDQAMSFEQFLQLGENQSDIELESIMQSVKPTDTMDMLFTSGTTGKPKGVMCGHSQNIRTVATWAETNGLSKDDHYLIINPFFHSFGYKAGWLAGLIKGATIYPVLTFNLEKVLKQIETDQITMLPGPPTIYQSILDYPNRDHFDLSSLNIAVTGAAPVSVRLIERMRTELNFSTIVTAYGLTETSGFVSICRPDDPAEIISHSSGRAMEGIEVKCVDSSGNMVDFNCPGEIWVKGYNVMQGYFDNEQATAEVITPDGWLKTGDVGVMDSQGYITITDRMKDMYISGGFNVYPAEIENTIASLQGVSQVAVVGVSDQRMGEVGRAFITCTEDSSLTPEQVIDYCKEHLANYKVPRSVKFVEAMPMNASGKITKMALREQA